MLQRGNIGDGCDLASTLCKYDMRKGDLFIMSWARVRRVRRTLCVCVVDVMDLVFSVIVRAGGAIWLNPFATVLFCVCSAITVECCV